MSLSGPLADLPLPHVLQLLANNRLSGTLWVTGHAGRANLELRDGKLVSLAPQASREKLGRLLLRDRLVSEKQLAEALEIQRVAGMDKRVGTILVEMGELEPHAVRRVIADQFATLLSDLFTWPTGHLHFQGRPPGHPEGEDAEDILHRHGLEVGNLVLAGLAPADDADEKDGARRG